MPQHAPEACNESDGLWLPITEYSVKSGVSLSTIRRKIKTNSLQFRVEKGKYFILFNGMNNLVMPKPQILGYPGSPRQLEDTIARKPSPANSDKEGKAEDAVRMVSDAFEHALREKEERIRLLEQRNHDLEERLNELRLLVRVLEEKYEVRY